MKAIGPMSMLLFATVLAAPFATAGEREPFHWPGGQRAAVSLAYDDALDSQLDHAIPALERHGFRASFYLPLSADTLRTRLPEWRAAAARGHELGNHTLFHQCSGSGADRAWVEPHRNLDTTTPEQMRDRVLLGNTMLEAIDGRRERTYTAPCGDLLASGRPYLPALRTAFVAVKAGGGEGVAASMATVDPYAVAVAGPVNASGKEMIALVRQAGARGTMVAFTFHGIGGDYLSVPAAAHEELLQYLSRHRDRYWVGTFVEIMAHVREQQAAAMGPE